MVFSDATLLAMAESHPSTTAGMLAIPGVGPVKLERYGAAFLEVLRRERAAAHSRRPAAHEGVFGPIGRAP